MTALTKDCDWQLDATLKDDAIVISSKRIERLLGQPRTQVHDAIDKWQSLWPHGETGNAMRRLARYRKRDRAAPTRER